MSLRGSIEQDVIRRRIAAQRGQMIDRAPELVFQVMDDRAGSRYALRHLGAAKSVQRFDLEMFAQREDCLLWQKRIAVVIERVIDFADLLLLFRGD